MHCRRQHPAYYCGKTREFRAFEAYTATFLRANQLNTLIFKIYILVQVVVVLLWLSLCSVLLCDARIVLGSVGS